MKFTVVVCLTVLLWGSLASASDKVYVNRTGGNDTTGDGTSAKPFASLQRGCDAVDAGGTVYVAPGVYDNGVTNTFTGCDTRLLIWKNLTLQATGERTNTVIRGVAATTSKDSYSLGLGDDAVRCITAASGTTVYINGFTICEGRTRYDDNGSGVDANVAGGVFGAGVSATYVQDCIIRACCATRGGGAYQCRIIRSFVTECKSSNVGAALRTSWAVNSIFTRNGIPDTGYGVFGYSQLIMNCTVVDNPTVVSTGQAGDIVNTVLFRNRPGLEDMSSSYKYCVSDDPSLLTRKNVTSCSLASYETTVFAPLTADYRVVTGGACDGTGDYTMNGIASYTGFTKDFFGQPRRDTANEKINIGAVQSAATPVGAPVILSGEFSGSQVVGAEESSWFGSVKTGRSVTHLNYEVEPVYPSGLKLKLPGEDESLGNLIVTNTAGDRIFVDRDETVLLPNYRLAAGEATVTNCLVKAVRAADVLFVDRAAADGGDGSSNAPFNRLQDAADVLNGNSHSGLIRVKGGRYAEGGKANCDAIVSRLMLKGNGIVRVVATEGAEETSIVGAADSGTTGLGANAVRCVENYGGIKVVSGFTLADGHAGDGTLAGSANRGGGAYRVYDTSKTIKLYLVDCVVTNCSAKDAAAVYNVECVGCRFFDCGRGVDTQLARASTLVSSLVWNCGPGDAGSQQSMFNSDISLYNVSVGKSRYRDAAGPGEINNSVFDSGLLYELGQGVYSTSKMYNSVYRDCYYDLETPVSGRRADCIKAPACYADNETGDLRLLKMSRAQGLASWDRMWKGRLTDAFGVAYVGSADGRFTAGAIEGGVAGAWIDTSYAAGVSPTGSKGFDENGEIAMTATKADVRPLLGFTVNGSLVETRDPAFTLKASDYPGVESFYVTATYGTNFWVDAVNGNETNSGFYADAAKKYIASAIALTEPDDVVIALPGVYDEETGQKHVDEAQNLTRVVVPERRTLMSRDGAETTVIAGRVATTEPQFPGYGLGPDAMRCVYLNFKAKLIGFTLRDGRTGVPASGTTDGIDYHGGGVLAKETANREVIDCIITNCASLRGGAAFLTTLERCRIVGNRCPHYAGTSVNSCALFRCFIDHSTGGTHYAYQGSMESCTVGTHNLKADGTSPATAELSIADPTTCYIRNSVFAAGAVNVANSNLVNCAFPVGASVGNTNVNSRCIFGEVQMTEDGVPVIGHNVAVDAADETIMSDRVKAKDLAGCTRIWNAARDIGAYEADWRPHYSTALCRRRLTVTDAPESAKEQSNGQIRLVDGALTATWDPVPGGSCIRELNYSVPGTGTLTVSVNGTIVDTVTSGKTKTYRFDSGVTADALAFAYEPGADDELGALIGSFKDNRGVMLIFR